ncbi:hypothetical protein AB3Y40_04590 [Yoonia sp. R2331]|uniref:hypothetical protein n=1 Tax=Yoonia sp. R2331 TaxID=3237238 RepID=UPI0034E37EF0
MPAIPVPDPHFDCPVAVSDYLLDITRRAYFERDRTGYAARFILPQVIDTIDGVRNLQTVADLMHVYDEMCRIIQTKGVIDFKRHTLSAVFEAPDTVRCTSISQHLYQDYRLSEEMMIHSLLRRRNGRWKIAKSQYVTADSRMNAALIAGGRKLEKK